MRTSAVFMCGRRGAKPPVPPNRHLELGYARHLPEAYVRKEKKLVPERVYENRFGAPPLYRWHFRHKLSTSDYIETGHRPWEQTAKQVNYNADQRRTMTPDRRYEHPDYPPMEPIPPHQWVFFAGDLVRIMVGPDKGKDGYVKAVSRARNHVYVEGLHAKYEFREGDEAIGYRGSYELAEQPLDVHKQHVMLLDPADKEPTTAQWQLVEATADEVQAGEERLLWKRVSDTTGHPIPVPTPAKRTYQYQLPTEYVESDKDTPAEVAMQRTYVPTAGTFEEDVCERMGIVDERRHGDTYWY